MVLKRGKLSLRTSTVASPVDTNRWNREITTHRSVRSSSTNKGFYKAAEATICRVSVNQGLIPEKKIFILPYSQAQGTLQRGANGVRAKQSSEMPFSGQDVTNATRKPEYLQLIVCKTDPLNIQEWIEEGASSLTDEL